jgi:shikimate kinase
LSKGITRIGKSHSAISVVNALATGKGSTIGIDLGCEVRATLIDKASFLRYKKLESGVVIENGVRDRHNLIKTCKTFTERFLKLKIPDNKVISFKIESEIPQAVGLKSSSAIAIASVEAVSKILGRELDYQSILRVSCRASKDSGASLTGAYDDAAGCYLGGMVLANNLKFRLVKHIRVPESLGKIVMIRLKKKERKYTSSVDTKVYSPFRAESLKSFEYAKLGLISQAMLLNSIVQCSALGYSLEPVSSALDEGATTAGISGKGPSVAAVCQSSKIANAIEKRWKDEAESHIDVIETTVVQPRRLIPIE